MGEGDRVRENGSGRGRGREKEGSERAEIRANL